MQDSHTVGENKWGKDWNYGVPEVKATLPVRYEGHMQVSPGHTKARKAE